MADGGWRGGLVVVEGVGAIMSDTPRAETDTSEDVWTDKRGRRQTTANSIFKMLGELETIDGTAVLGVNTADTGTPIGVTGSVPKRQRVYERPKR
jgi:hypothetical protein